MKTFYRLVAFLMCLLLPLSMAHAATEEFADRITFSATSINLPDNVSFMDDAVYQTFDEMFNFEYDLINISWETWDERDRLWITSGDMPDMLFWNFNLKDYLSFSEQGLIKELPEDLEEKYPNLAAAMAKTGIADYLETIDENHLVYMIPNVIYLIPPTETTDLIVDAKVLYYRKDWAQAVGIEVGDTITTGEIVELGKAFIENDPGNNGPGNTVGFTAVPAYVNSTFVQSRNAFYNQFYRNEDGQYVWGGFDETTLAGIENLKACFETGIIDPDYYAFKGKEHYEKFDSGIAGMFVDGASAANVDERFNSFARSNPDIDPADAIGLATVVGDDGVYRGEQNLTNFWAGLLFNPDIEDEKLHRILSILDYICTEEGQRLIHCGIEGVDYEMDDDTIIITREKDVNGNFVSIADVYPSYNFFFTKAVLPDDWSARDPSLPSAVRDIAVKMFHIKEQSAELVPPDYDIILFNGEKKLKFSVNINDAITGIIFSNEDVAKAWNAFLDENRQIVQDVLDEINAGIE